jgi:hypothetical protein
MAGEVWWIYFALWNSVIFFFDVRALIVQNLVIFLLPIVLNDVDFHLLEWRLMGPILSIAKLKHKLTSWVTLFSHMAICFVYYCHGLKFLCCNASAVTHYHRRNEYAGEHNAKFLQNGCAKEGMVKMNTCTYMTSVCSNLNLCLLMYCILCLWLLCFCAVFMK